ncbi:hypothetical protein GYMLUDRAFT_558062 [Collybiopsis luxurians FD-317 M1]|uniref:Uncharacterized protein n=1 Tax=Collybiopsis luxurians FD-317 M1 TaxID=944289 RepID=A0A0D0C127_9AGAR|nr:hypothetical protein GYMLUDRAFT_558062 [Collybiopsis luxurians FD-317 M1]
MMSTDSEIELDSIHTSTLTLEPAVTRSISFPDDPNQTSEQHPAPGIASTSPINVTSEHLPSSSNSARSILGIELELRNEEQPNDDARISSLPPVDGGFHAWAYLVSAWCIELLVWSFPFSYGIFLNFYTTSPTSSFLHSSSSTLALVGSLSSGLLYLSSPIVLPIINRYPWYKRHVMILGVVLCVAGLIGAAYAETVTGLIVTQGVMYSLGGSGCLFFFFFEDFDRERLMNPVRRLVVFPNDDVSV